MDRIGDSVQRVESEVGRVIETQAKHAEQLTRFDALNVQERFVSSAANQKILETRIDKLEDEESQRKGGIAALRLVWAALGVITTVAIAAVSKLVGV